MAAGGIWKAAHSLAGRGIPHLASTDGTGHCASCGRAVKLRLDGKAVTHKTANEHCPGSGQEPSADVPLACWLPVKDGLTLHGLWHSHKTWMAEDGIPEILAEQGLGHDVPWMRGLYAGLTSFPVRSLAIRSVKKMISQIPPDTATAPIPQSG
jgi:hypothetical protein